MLDICDRNAKNVINYFIHYIRSGPNYIVRRTFPAVDSEIYASRILEFGFSCCAKPAVTFKRGVPESTSSSSRVGERFVIVFTDAKGTMEFVFCHRPNDEVALCLSSALPWGSCFHSLLDIIWRNDLHLDSRWHALQVLLSRLRSMLPPPRTIGYLSCPDPFNSVRILKFPIPTPRHPHNIKYLMEYYTALDISLWIHIFVWLILERSVLFYSKRFTRLTACVMTSVALLYPLQWVHSFYPLIPTKVLEVLGCPVPFVAGIHACNLQAALEYLNPGSCLVDLDSGQIQLFHSPSQPDHGTIKSLATPKAVYHFLRNGLDRVQNQLNSALSSTKLHAPDWKLVDGEACSFVENLTQPFFLLIANLLGCYRDCLTDATGSPDVDIDALIAYQNCPELEPFLRMLCESQCVRLFFDSRIRQPPDPNVDAFESVCWSLRTSCKRQRSKRVHLNSSFSNPAMPASIALTLNGSSLPRFQDASEVGEKYRGRVFTFGSEQWLRSKKIKHPGEVCSWEDNCTFAVENKQTTQTSSSYWTKWSRKFRARTGTLRNLSGSKDILPQDDSTSQVSFANTSISNFQIPDSTRPLTHLSHAHDLSSADAIASETRKPPPEKRVSGFPKDVTPYQQSVGVSIRKPKSMSNAPSPSNLDDNTSLKPRPPRPPPPRSSHNGLPSQPDCALMSVSASPQPEQDISNHISCTAPKARPEFHCPKEVLQAHPDVRVPPPLPSRPISCYFSNGVNLARPLTRDHSETSIRPTKWHTNVRNIAPITPDPLFATAIDARAMSSVAVHTPSDNLNRSITSRSRAPRRPVSQLFTQSLIGPIQFTDNSQLLLRRLGSLSERSSSIPVVTRRVHTATAVPYANRDCQSHPRYEIGPVAVPDIISKFDTTASICLASKERSDYENLPYATYHCSTNSQYTKGYPSESRPQTASLPMQPILANVPARRPVVSALESPSISDVVNLMDRTAFSSDRKSNSAHNLATGDSTLLSRQDMDAKINPASSSWELCRKCATSPQCNETDVVASNRWQWVCTANCHRTRANSSDTLRNKSTRRFAPMVTADPHFKSGFKQDHDLMCETNVDDNVKSNWPWSETLYVGEPTNPPPRE